MFAYVLIILTTLFYLIFVAFVKKKYSYWSSRGINGPKPFPIVGNFSTVLLFQESATQFFQRIYNEFPNEKVVGVYRGFQPVLLIRDPELLKCVLIKDFHLFQDRGLKVNQHRMNDNLFVIEGEKWRILRQKLTPVFTSGKLKGMLPQIQNCVDDYIEYVDRKIKNEPNNEYEVRSLKAKYTLQVIGNIAFGMNLHTITDEDNEFAKTAKKIFSPSIKLRFWIAMEMLLPGIRRALFKISENNAELFKFFIDLVSEIIKDRKDKPVIRKDFMDFMIEMKEQGKVSRRDENRVSEIEIDDEMIAAQALIFYSAGFETSSATMSFLIHELAHNQNMQDRLHKEIAEVYQKHDGKLTYESLSEMTYLDMVFDETLRKYPVAGTLARKSSSNYKFPDDDITVEKGIPVFASVIGLQHDPKYFPEPELFNPEHFAPENKNTLERLAYIPFGAGPRNCIGLRFAKVQSLMALAGFLKEFKVTPSEKTKPVLEIDPKAITLTSKGGIWVKINKR